MNQCIICGKPRDGGRIWCGDDACLPAALAMQVEDIAAIREREELEALRKQGTPYIHMMPRE